METLEQNPVMNQDPAMGPAPQFQPDGARPMLVPCWAFGKP